MSVFLSEVLTMLDPKLFEEFNARVSAMMATGPVQDFEKNFKAVLAGLFAKMDLVTREEFDTQANVLARTRQLVDQLTARLDELEKNAK